jgi:ADP-ribosylglycohydrolase
MGWESHKQRSTCTRCLGQHSANLPTATPICLLSSSNSGLFTSPQGTRYNRPYTLNNYTYSFNESCQETVPGAIIAFLESDDYEDAVRLAISLGGEADILACIAGGIAGAFYGSVPASIANPALALLDDGLRETATRFCKLRGVAMP